MMQRESYIEHPEKGSSATLILAKFFAGEQKHIDEFFRLQSELVDKLHERDRRWFGRLQAEANLASELATRLAAACSIAEAMAVCQRWANRRFDMIAEDEKRFLTDTQKLAETSARLWSNSWLTGSDGGNTTPN